MSPREVPFKNIPGFCAIPYFQATFREKSPQIGKKSQFLGYFDPVLLSRFSRVESRSLNACPTKPVLGPEGKILRKTPLIPSQYRGFRWILHPKSGPDLAGLRNLRTYAASSLYPSS